MVRALLAAVAAVALLAAAPPPADGIDAYKGGQLRSPDRAWTISASPVAKDGIMTVAMLRGPGVPQRRLTRFERYLRVIWIPGTPKVLLVEQSAHISRISSFTLDKKEHGPKDRIEADIENVLAANGPQLGTIENRLMDFGKFGLTPCVLVEESGLPPDRDDGSFIARRHAFRLDAAAGRAVPIKECPGARLE